MYNKRRIILSEEKLHKIIKNAVAEAIGTISGTPTRLYHGTSFDALNNILDSGFICASDGRQHGETRGVNWFSTNYNENYSKGVVISISCTPDDFRKGNFKMMNNTTVTSDGDFRVRVPIQDRDFRIEKFGFISSKYDFDVLYNMLKMFDDDIFEVREKLDKLYDRYIGYTELVNVDNPIFVQLLKQIGRQDLLQEYGII